MKLSDAPAGKYRIDAVLLGPLVRRRLAVLGIICRAEMEVIRRRRGDAVLARAAGAKYAIGRRTADGIRVTGEK